MKKFRDNKPINDKTPDSKTKLGLCKNIECKNKRRDKSAYCQECADKLKE